MLLTRIDIAEIMARIERDAVDHVVATGLTAAVLHGFISDTNQCLLKVDDMFYEELETFEHAVGEEVGKEFLDAVLLPASMDEVEFVEIEINGTEYTVCVLPQDQLIEELEESGSIAEQMVASDIRRKLAA